MNSDQQEMEDRANRDSELEWDAELCECFKTEYREVCNYCLRFECEEIYDDRDN